MQNKKLVNQKLVCIFIFIILCLPIIINFILDYPINSDDADMLLYEYKLFDLSGYSLKPSDITFFHLTSFLFYFLSGFTVKSIYLAEITEIVVLLFLSLCIVSLFCKNIKQLFVAELCFFIMFVCQSDKGSILLRYHNNVNFIFLIQLLFFCLFIYKKNNRKWIYYVWLLISVYAYSSDDSLIYMVSTLPFFFTFIFLYKKSKERSHIIYAILTIVAVLIARLGNMILGFFIQVNEKGGFYASIQFASIDAVSDNFKGYIGGILNFFNANFFETEVLSISSFYFFIKIVAIILIIYILISELVHVLKNKETNDVIVLIALGFLFVSFAFIFSNVYVDYKSARYMDVIAYTFPIVISLWIFDNWNVLSEFVTSVKNGKKLLIVMICVVCALMILFFPKMDFQRVITKQDRLAKFLVEHDLKYGYAPFWSASSTMACADGKVFLHAIYKDSENSIAYLGNSDFWIKDDSISANFVVIPIQQPDEDEWNGGITEELAVNIWGKPKEIYKLDEYVVYIYDYDIKNILQTVVYCPDNSLIKYSDNCDITAEAAILETNSVMYGPYISLSAGEYSITLHGDNLSEEDVYFTITADCGKIEIPYTIQTEDDYMKECYFNLADDTSGIEFVVYNASGEKVMVEDYVVENQNLEK